MAKSTESWKDISAKMLKHREETIAAVIPSFPEIPKALPLNVTGIPGPLLPQDVIAITETAPESLVAKLATGQLSSLAVT